MSHSAALSTLCYMEKDGKYLMLHRTVKKKKMMSTRTNGSVSGDILRRTRVPRSACCGRSGRRPATG